MSKKITAYILILSLLAFSGCSSSASSSSSSSSDETSSISSSSHPEASTVSSDEFDLEFTSRDLDASYDEALSGKITFSGNNASINGSGVEWSDGVLTISSEGTYIISGNLTDGQILVKSGDTDKVQLVLDGASIYCSNNPALLIESGDKIFITLAEGSKNSLSSGSEYYLTADDGVDGVVFSRSDLTFNGSGSLSVTANYAHGIVSKDDLVITGGTYDITAVKSAISGKDCVKIASGVFVLNAGSDGIKSTNSDESDRGFIYISDGDFTITSSSDGLQAENILRIDSGSFNITSGGGSANQSFSSDGSVNQDWGAWHGGTSGKGGMGGSFADRYTSKSSAVYEAASDTSSAAFETSDSAKGIKSTSSIIINGGNFTIDSSDDSVHSNSSVNINGGGFAISSGDDGMHADNAMVINGSTINISKSYEGIEGLTVDISGGDISVTSNDDGINAAGGSDTGMAGRPGQNSFSSGSSAYIKISGGKITVNAQGDGVDANGALYIEGGTLYVSGSPNNSNAALDFDGTAEINGGIVIAAGMSGMTESISSSSSQCSITYVFPSSLSAGDTITVTDSTGRELASFTPEKTYNCVVFSSPEMTVGETYTISAGSISENVIASSIATSNGSSSGGIRGGFMK